MVTPSTALLTDPKSMRSETIFFTILTGTANEYPAYAPVCDTIAVLIPTRLPALSTRAPPLLPGLTAASVWMNDSILNSLLLSGMDLPFALTMPAVTVERRLYGLPIASTHSPRRSLSESPNGIVGSPWASTFIRATSVAGSAPISSALNVLLLVRVTSISVAPSITWLLVTIYPSSRMMTPEPLPTLSLS